MIEELEQQIKVVAQARLNKEFLAGLKAKAMIEWETQHSGLLDDLGNNASFLTEAETRLRELTLEAYRETGNKTPCQGVAVREVTKLDYDPLVALGWATDHRIMLKLDIPAFEKYVKALPLEFVQIRQEPHATISQDLSKYIKEEEK